MKRFDDLLLFIGADKKKELLKITLINVLLIASVVVGVILLKQIMISFLGAILLVVINYVIFDSYINKKKEIIHERDQEFITMIGYFQFFINNSYNVYRAFQSLMPYASVWMEEQLNSLILEIDNDKSVKPFVNFASKFNNRIANNVMLSIYQMVDEGENSVHMLQFNALFEQINHNLQKELIDNKDKSLSSLSSLPLIGAGAVTVLLTFGIISVMGEMINVL